MAKIPSSGFKVFLVSGVSMLGAKPKSVVDKVTNVLQANTHGLGDEWVEHSATGQLRGELSQAGAFFDTATDGMHQAWKALTNVARLVMYAISGNTIGQIFVGWQGVYEGSYDALAKVGGLVEANATYAVSGQVDRGLIVQDWTAKTADWTGPGVDFTLDPLNASVPITSNSAANPSVVTTPVPHKLTTGDRVLISGVAGSNADINGERVVTVLSATTFSVPVNATTSGGTGGQFVRASTSAGAVGYLAASAASGFTNFVGTLEHSDDDVSYSTLLTFTDNVAAPFAERKTVAGTVKRYVRFKGDVTGSGSITPFAGVSRNPPA